MALHGGHWLHKSGMHPLAVVQVALIHTAQQDLGGGNVGGNGYAVHITQAEQILLVGAAAVGPERVAEEQHQIHFIAGNTGGDLLDAAQLSGEVTVNWQAGGLVQHPAGGTGGNDSVPGQDTTVGGAELKRSCLPDSPKIGSVTLSPRGDWRMPSDACAALWLAELEQLFPQKDA